MLLSVHSSSVHQEPLKVVAICDYSGPCLEYHSRKTSAEAVTFCDHLTNRQLIFCTLIPLPVELELTKSKAPLLGLLFIDFFGFLGNGNRERESAW